MWFRSNLKTGGPAPAPSEKVIPEFVIEYEKTDPTVEECSFTIIKEGLYFLAQVGCSSTAGGLYINSSDGQIWYTQSGSDATGGIVCAFATLYPGDTVRYLADGGYTNLGLVRHAIRILNAQFDSVTSIDMVFNQATSSYDILNIDEPSFIYFGGSYSGATASDSSSINGSVCDTYAKIADDKTSVSRVVTCCDTDDGGTISASGATYCRTLFLNAKLIILPKEKVAPAFVVEYENIAIDGSAKTWTVVNSGLYFLEVTGSYRNAALSVSSSNSPYFDHTMDKYIKNRYMCIDLDAGDIVTYSGQNSNSIFHAIRFTNCTFDSIIEESSIQDNWTEYDAPSADGAYFMYGSCCGRSGWTQKDESVASGDCNVYSVSTSNGCAMAHIIACTNQSPSATIKMYGYDNGGSSVVCLKMTTSASAPTFTVPEFNKTLLVDNSSEASSFTLTGDYHDYDFVLIKVNYNGTIETLFIPPSVIDACTTSPFTYFTPNRRYSNIYASYSISGNTWTRAYNRTTNIIEIYGCNCINATVSETEIYHALAISSAVTTVQYAGDLTDFDYIFAVCNASDPTECIVNDTIWTPTKMVNENTFTMNEYTNGGYVINNSISYGDTSGYPMTYYQAPSATVTITEHELSSARYSYVTGIKFTPD